MKNFRQFHFPTPPKRFSELVAIFSVTSSIFLFFHTQVLTARIEHIQGVITSSAGSARENQIGGSSLSSTSSKVRNQDENPNNLIISPQNHSNSAYNGNSDVLQIRGISSFTLPNKIYKTAELNNTKKATREILFFNRTPKVGSQLIMDLIQRLAQQNSFEFQKDGTQKVEAIRLTYHEESRLTSMINMFNPPSAYVKHTCMSNFTRHGYPMPIYMNLVRDPIERVISWFYYIRAPWYIIERKQAFPELQLPDPQWLKKDFESCVLSGDRECSFIPGEYFDGVGDHRRQAMFFCGHEDACLEFNGEWVIEQAKRNVDEYYAVVGVLEEMELSLFVIEKYIPKFFSGASRIYYDNMIQMKKINKNIYKPPVSEKVKNLLRANFTKEIEFYEFCKQRLHKQYVALLQEQKI